MESKYTKAIDASDLPRASVAWGVSAFDFLQHEIFRIEVLHRFSEKISISRLLIPIDILYTTNNPELLSKLDAFIKAQNSFKSFVDPDKLADMLRFFIDEPWSRLAAEVKVDPKILRGRLSKVYSWRNRIVHEADIDPSFAGATLWPIAKDDVDDALTDIERLGKATISVLLKAAP